MRHAWFGIAMFTLAGCGQGWPIATVSSIDVQRYMGHWYEVASYPLLFQRGCTHSQADYALDGDGQTVWVTNSCWRKGAWSCVKGSAYVADAAEPGHFVVTLKVPVAGNVGADYHVLALDPDYQWAMVGHPTRKYLWLLSRQPTLESSTITMLASQAEHVFDYRDAHRQLRCTEQEGGDVAACQAALAAVLAGPEQT